MFQTSNCIFKERSMFFFSFQSITKIEGFKIQYVHFSKFSTTSHKTTVRKFAFTTSLSMRLQHYDFSWYEFKMVTPKWRTYLPFTVWFRTKSITIDSTKIINSWWNFKIPYDGRIVPFVFQFIWKSSSIKFGNRWLDFTKKIKIIEQAPAR